MKETQEEKFINDIMEVVDEYLNNRGDAAVLVDFFSATVDVIQKQIINQEGERPTLH